jgi:hypothetical protein
MNQSRVLGAKLKSMVIVFCGTVEFLKNARALLQVCQASAQRASWAGLLVRDLIPRGLRWGVGPGWVAAGLFIF